MKQNCKEIWLVYDGECLLCRASAHALKIRKAVGVLHIINAREEHPIIDEISHAGLKMEIIHPLGGKYLYAGEFKIESTPI